MTRRPPRSTLFPTRRSSDLGRKLYPRFKALADSLKNIYGEQYIEKNRLPKVDSIYITELEVNGINFRDRKSTRLNSSHVESSYAVFCLKKNTYSRTDMDLLQ